MKIDWKTLWSALKEPLRILVLAVIPFLIAWLTELGYEWAVVATLFLRFLDSYLHEKAKAEPKTIRNEGILGEHGLTGF